MVVYGLKQYCLTHYLNNKSIFNHTKLVGKSIFGFFIFFNQSHALLKLKSNLFKAWFCSDNVVLSEKEVPIILNV
jgi:hypothetical protein